MGAASKINYLKYRAKRLLGEDILGENFVQLGARKAEKLVKGQSGYYGPVSPKKSLVPVKDTAGEASGALPSSGFFNKGNMAKHAVGALATVSLINAMSGSKGQMTNAQLYGQEPMAKQYNSY